MPKRTNDGIKKRCAHKRKTWNDCACPWWFRFYYDGREYAFSLTKVAQARGEAAPKSREQAVAWRDRLRTEIRAGEAASAGEVTLINTVPSALAALLEAGAVSESTRVINLAGEALKAELMV